MFAQHVLGYVIVIERKTEKRVMEITNDWDCNSHCTRISLPIPNFKNSLCLII